MVFRHINITDVLEQEPKNTCNKKMRVVESFELLIFEGLSRIGLDG